jgi:hypothetical protein
VSVAAVCGTRGNYLSAFVCGRAITSRDVFSESALLRQVFPLSFLHKMSFEDVEERDGVQLVHSRPGVFISSFFQAFDCRGTFGLHLALRPIAP